ncbi:hypothetical protein SNE40_016352 [Patella caerulea]|uniref:Uncharacterized protein n=1 Tax=Patella caerulea TaxID=87958 RepID=A0AAN8J8L7_PATCE
MLLRIEAVGIGSSPHVLYGASMISFSFISSTVAGLKVVMEEGHGAPSSCCDIEDVSNLSHSLSTFSMKIEDPQHLAQ